ncbi:MAG: quinone-dependent dihydroorotate dehydrogenase [Bacteroidales bacterium]|nr:quinone-dependent dihydroorotate dehydrogenase [Bacteroidales bacterium]MBN2749167.1 quinone-dependent dihydroorotate dehydrogenase [Bacteroidales bacterium]
MYKSIIRPILFLLSPEKVHHLVVLAVKVGFKIPGVKALIRKLFRVSSPNLETTVAGLTFPNPVGLAAGFDKDATFFGEFASFGFGFIEIGTVTPKAQPGNPRPRSFRLLKDGALINRMGFNNLGVDNAVENLKKARRNGIVIGGNIGKNTLTPNEQAVSDYQYTFKALYPYVDYLVINISCPNVANLRNLQDKDSLGNILEALGDIRRQQAAYKPIFLKVSPDLTTEHLDETLETAIKLGVDGFIATNTTTSRDNLSSPAELVTSIGNGGLSGRPIAQRSTEVIRHIRKKLPTIPIIGVGGIFSAHDALEKIDAGANLVQIYTGFIYSGPSLVKRINNELLKRGK